MPGSGTRLVLKLNINCLYFQIYDSGLHATNDWVSVNSASVVVPWRELFQVGSAVALHGQWLLRCPLWWFRLVVGKEQCWFAEANILCTAHVRDLHSVGLQKQMTLTARKYRYPCPAVFSLQVAKFEVKHKELNLEKKKTYQMGWK